MCSGVGDRTCLLPGFPIRKSSDHSSVGSSPRLIAASYVLHRLLVPRHPPGGLTNLATKMLASTVQFSRYGRSRSPPTACLPIQQCGRGDGSAWTGPSATEPPIQKGRGLVSPGLSALLPTGVGELVQIPQDPTACLGRLHREAPSVPTGKPAVLGVRLERDGLLVSVPPLSDPPRERMSRAWFWTEPVDGPARCSLERR